MKCIHIYKGFTFFSILSFEMTITDLFKDKSVFLRDKHKLSLFLSENSEKDQSIGVKGSEEPSFQREKEVAEDRIDKEELSRTLFIGNLPLECAIDKKEQEKFKKWFVGETSAKLESIRFRKLIAFKSGQVLPNPNMLLLRKSRKLREKALENSANGSVNAYIVLKRGTNFPELDSIISKLNGIVYCGRHLRVDRTDSITNPSHKKTIFLGNLPLDLQEEDLWRAFEKFPLKISSLRLIRDKNNNVGKGIAFVTFSERGMVRQSIDLFKKDPLVIKNRIARVSKCNGTK